jgi:hypothetical protein
MKDRSLTTLKEKLIKIGAKVVSHGRYVALQMAEGRRSYSQKSVRRYLTNDRRTTAATGCVNGMNHSIIMRSLQTTGEVRFDNGKGNILGRSARSSPAPTPRLRTY